MRRSLAFVLVAMLAACGTDSSATGGDAGGGGGDSGGGGGGDGGGGGGTDGGGSGSGGSVGCDPNATFCVQSKDVVIMPGQEITYCYYFHTPNTAQLAIQKWSSDMTAGSHHVIMFYGSANQPADDTLDPSGNCGAGGGGLSVPVWVYASQTQHGELVMPSDDGNGKPLGMLVPPNQPAYFQMHYLNASDNPITAHVDLNAYAYPANTQYTPTAAFVTYNGNISIPPHATNHVESQTCTVPSGVKFWTVSTHSHKQSIATDLKDGTATGPVVFSSTDWEHPGAKTWTTTPFYTFTSGKMTYECTYNNTGDNQNNTVVDGQSAATNEMCMGTGYMFPATQAKFCYTNLGPF